MTEQSNLQNYTCLAGKYRNRRKAAGILSWILIALVIIGIIGLIVTLIMLGVGDGTHETLLFILSGCCLGAIALFGTFGFLFIRLSEKLGKRELDYEELSDSEDSFFVGDGTIARFCEGELLIYGETSRGKRAKTVRVPYREMRFFSICSRHRPKEKGEWSVVLEIPVKYLAKDGKTSKNDSPALIQTDSKERLYACLKKYGLGLSGELPVEKHDSKKFLRLQKYILPDTEKRKKSLLFLLFGGAVFIGGIVLAVLWNVTIGALVCVLGFYFAIHSAINYAKEKSTFYIYREGVFWKEKTLADSTFLKWEEIVSLSKEEKNGTPCLETECLYGSYSFPCVGSAYEYIKEHFPEKCRK